jgi:hypothetical protein
MNASARPRRAGDHDDGLPREVRGFVDRLVVELHEDLPTRFHVGVREVDDRLALLRHGYRREEEIDLAGIEELKPVRGHDRDELDRVRLAEEIARDVVEQIDFEPHVLVTVEEPERRIVGLDPDDHLPARFDRGEPVVGRHGARRGEEARDGNEAEGCERSQLRTGAMLENRHQSKTPERPEGVATSVAYRAVSRSLRAGSRKKKRRVATPAHITTASGRLKSRPSMSTTKRPARNPSSVART